ncbi:hypothetical protein N7457_000117, partial [Penicillium paradoxum]|uniref:uncharacterized protein n=1 Tax=Penicillium paradoxum TaxID=176176 RepID=UPI0025499446
PFTKNWNLLLPSYYTSQNIVFSIISAFNLITDIIIIALPSITEPALTITNSYALILRPIYKAAFLSLFGSAKDAYSTQPASGPILSKSTNSRRMNGIDKMDSEYPLTRLHGDI